MKRAAPLIVLALLLAAPQATATIGKTWKTSGTEQFAAGKLKGVSVLSTGPVELAPEAEKIEGVEAEFVWDVEAAADGTVYVATGGPAAVYVLKAGRAELLHESEQKHVLSVLPLPDGSVLAGTAPQAVIFRIDRHGKTTTFADLEDSYVWDMAIGPHNRIYCATGPEGRLMELNRAGEVTELLKAKQKNLMCVTVDEDGTVYAGTDTDGYIYRIERGERSAVLYDAEESEVHDLVVGPEGELYACTAQSRPAGRTGGPPSGSSEKRPERPAEPPSPSPGAGAPAAHNSIYRIVPGQGAVLLARFDKMFVLSLALAGDRVLAGTGTDGRLMAVGPDMLYRILTEFDVGHVTAMAVLQEGDVIIGTSNAGNLWRLKPGYRDRGSLVSEPFDAGYLSRWGRASWKQKTATGQNIRLKVRTGNSGEPDEHWSEWSDWATDPDGEALEVPMGRFVQFQTELSTRAKAGTPVLLEVNLSYRQANRKPRIEDLTVDGQSLLGRKERAGTPSRARPSGASAQRNARAAREPGAPSARKSIAWKASDPNGDELFFELYYRGLDEAEWKEIDEDLRDKTSYTWDTSRTPDGHYLLRLIARDDAVRPEGEALADQKVTNPLLIDNRRPAVLDLRARRRPDGSFELSGVAQDEHSRITAIEVSRNSEDWLPVFPTDGILDSLREPFSHRTEPLEPGEHVFVVAATDSSRNTGSGKVVVTVEAAGQ